MAELAHNSWGKTDVRLSKLRRGADEDDFIDITARVSLEGDVSFAHTAGDNAGVVPTDTMKNTIYGLAQDHLTDDLEGFASVLAGHFLEKDWIDSAEVELSARLWQRVTPTGFIGGGSELRTAGVTRSRHGTEIRAGIEGLVVLKTTGSGFAGFPHDEFTILPEADDRILATSITATWRYAQLPEDTTSAWQTARRTLVERFFGDRSESVQHQGWMMGVALLDAVPEIDQVTFRLPNQHHLPFDLARFGMDDAGIVFQPVSEPYGDIAFTITR
jgi:urate oxidase